MNKFIAIFSLSVLLAGCDESLIKKVKTEPVEEPKVDIYRATNEYNSKKISDVKLNEPQQNTINEIILGVETFFTEKSEENFPTINSYAKKQNWDINYYSDESYSDYRAKLKDGSGASILFKHFVTKDYNTHYIHVWGLTPNQCYYLVNQYKYRADVKVEVEEYYSGPDKSSSQSSSCDKLGTEDGKKVSVSIEHNNEPYANDYDKFNFVIAKLFDKKYEESISNYGTSIYFSKEPVSYKIFRDGIDYAINTTNNHITIGYVTKDRCKEILYHLPENIKAKVNDNGKCNQEVNTMEFFK